MVHRFPSLHEVPVGAGGLEQTPLAALHTPTTWQASAAVHTTGEPPEHVPAWQLSPMVHALPSSQPAPLALFGFEHAPVAALQVPATWH